MVPWLYDNFGNPASRSHAFGWEAEDAVENARQEVANLVNADPREIIWTSGATESDNLAIKGAANFYAERGRSEEHTSELQSLMRISYAVFCLKKKKKHKKRTKQNNK